LEDPLPFTTHINTQKETLENRTGLPAFVNVVADFPRIVLRVKGNQGWRMVLKKKIYKELYDPNSATSTREKRNKDLVIHKTLKQTHV
jgi:hypothetical protein